MSVPSLARIPQKQARTNETDDPDSPDSRFELLPQDLKDKILYEADCDSLPKWCQLIRCDGDMWRRACLKKGWESDKPDYFSWRIWYARKCRPNWARGLDEGLYHSVMIQKNVRMARAYLDKGASVNTYGKGLLLKSTFYTMDREMLDLLFNRGSMMTDITNDTDTNILVEAADQGKLEVVKLLFEYGAPTKNGETITMAWLDRFLGLEYDEQRFMLEMTEGHEMANHIEDGHVDVVRLLLTYGGDQLLNGLNEGERAPLYLATVYDNLEIIKILIDRGARMTDLTFSEAMERNRQALLFFLRYNLITIKRIVEYDNDGYNGEEILREMLLNP